MPHDVFISYSHLDQTIADSVCACLERAGMACWIAHRDIRPGDDWPKAIPPAIEAARIVVLIFSMRANESDYVVREVTLAADAKKPL
ncbi:MAG TPA: toll/interleukin-1 receptor domain-containing protein, partial [Armatimonadota bacterium]